jgi:nucleoid-associated protein YgaU
MRTEFKIAIVLAFVAIAVILFWNAYRQRGMDTIPIDKTAMDSSGGADFALKRDAQRPAQPAADTHAAGRTQPSNRAPAPGGAPSEHDSARPAAPAQTPPVVTAPQRPALRDSATQPADASTAQPTTAPVRREFASASPATRPAPSFSSPAVETAPPARRDTQQPTETTPPRETAPAARPNATSARLEARPADAAPRQYTIQEGDTLIAIAAEQYGDAAMWRRIKEANPGLEETRLLVGKAIVLPPKESAARPAAAPAEKPAAAVSREPDSARRAATEPAARNGKPRAGSATYVVGKGDSLIQIARNVLKDGNRWREIWELNRDKLRSPDHIEEGMELKLPEPR